METIELTRDCEAIAIPKGLRHTLTKGTAVRIVQQRQGSYTVTTPTQAMYRIDAKDADALGVAIPSTAPASAGQVELTEQLVWNTLKTVYDPELPVNIVDLGLIYSCSISSLAEGRHTIAVRMAMTSPGCGMSDILKSEVEKKLARLPQVAEAHVEVVFDPPWDPSRMSEEARLQVGMDLGNKRDFIQISPNRS
ncbi:MAG TPA: putative Fe-S cluster assembly protein SufT [Terracidiphilus sp.]|jgi:probable FeS assembly SUF system protein SufT